jgi:hypothetical protein
LVWGKYTTTQLTSFIETGEFGGGLSGDVMPYNALAYSMIAKQWEGNADGWKE